ncbi:MAG: DNA repair protein RecN [Gammaproteobacteria bacterium]
MNYKQAYIMLQYINIQNFTIINQLELELKSGLTALTGETGAGKSIILDALQLALGERTDTSLIRHGCDRCEIAATFTLSPSAKHWLMGHDIDASDNAIILRRVIAQDGRSRGYIQGQPAPLQLLKDVGNLLVNIYGQNEHQSLRKRDAQRELLDAEYSNLVETVRKQYEAWHKTHAELDQLRTQDHTARSAFLRYQIQELDALGLTESELAQLETEHKQLAHANQLLSEGHAALDMLVDNKAITKAHHLLAGIQNIDPQVTPITELLNTALIQTQETLNELRNYLEKLELNPERLIFVEQRLQTIYDLARKHRIQPENLHVLHQTLLSELKQLENTHDRLAQLEKSLNTALQTYKDAAKKLSLQRQKTAAAFSEKITTRMQTLGMPGGKFGISIEPLDAPSPHGLERIEFHVSANPGQPLQPLSKVASGGELSRISLAIQVMAAHRNTTPTLIFDEVDVGIGGGTAEIVGNLLRTLGETAQVLCVTHLPQVASKSHHHLLVQKHVVNSHTVTQIQRLDPDQKVQEIARMLGGLKITKQTLAHAKEMINN